MSLVAAYCPVCRTEYQEGPQACADDGAILVPGPAPQPTRGTLVVVRRDAESGERADLFEQEATPQEVVLVVMVPEDAPDLVEALGSEGIGARLGTTTDDGGVEVVIHDTNLPEAQAVLVDFTGDASILDDAGEDDDGFVPLASVPMTVSAAQTERLLAAGIDVRMTVPAEQDQHPAAFADIAVPVERVELARKLLGIEV